MNLSLPRRPQRVGVAPWLLPVLLLLLLPQAGCSTAGYYAQAVSGHLGLMAAREPIDEVMADPATPAAVRQRLELAQAARRFAIDELGLPDNGSYTSYVQLDRPAVVYNVYAAPAFSLEPKRWCFPVAGCVVYRGYFARADAERTAARLEGDGWDTWVGGASAYSTLGRFEDPVLSSMLYRDDARLAGLLFHELAHQRLYIKDDSAFNEAFATVVEEEGVHRWLLATGREDDLAAWRQSRRRAEAFQFLLARTRGQLQVLYASGAGEPEMRAGKAAAFAQLEAEYRALKDSWDGWTGFDRWFEAPLNNARLIPSATYRALVPAFRILLLEADGDLEAFYAEAERLGELPQAEREAEMRRLLATAAQG
jgi:predicted aminopeptidase